MEQEKPIQLQKLEKCIVASNFEEEKSTVVKSSVTDENPLSHNFDDPNDEDFKLKWRKPKKKASDAAKNFEKDYPVAFLFMKSQSAGFVHKWQVVKSKEFLENEALFDIPRELIKEVFNFQRKKVQFQTKAPTSERPPYTRKLVGNKRNFTKSGLSTTDEIKT